MTYCNMKLRYDAFCEVVSLGLSPTYSVLHMFYLARHEEAGWHSTSESESLSQMCRLHSFSQLGKEHDMLTHYCFSEEA